MALKCERCSGPFEGGDLTYSVAVIRGVYNDDILTQEGGERYEESMKEIFSRVICGDCAHTYKELQGVISDFLTPLKR